MDVLSIFWCGLIVCAYFVMNMIPSLKLDGKGPVEILNGKQASLIQLKYLVVQKLRHWIEQGQPCLVWLAVWFVEPTQDQVLSQTGWLRLGTTHL